MKTWKLVSGILSIVIAAYMIFQSFVSMAYEALVVGGYSGVAGLFSAGLILAAGIVSIVSRKKEGGDVACVILFALAAVIGFSTFGGAYGDLIVWSVWASVCAIVLLIRMLLNPCTKAAFMRLYFHPSFIAGCICAAILGAVFGSLLPLVVYCVGYIIVILIRGKKDE